MQRNQRLLCVLLGAVGVVLASTAGSALAAELVIKNDSETDGSTATPCPCFIAGEEVAVWLTSPVAGNIVGVQVLWKSTFGGAPDSQEMAIRLRNGTTFPPAPIGALLQNQDASPAVITAPILTDGLYNEYRHLDQAMTIPLSVPVTPGQTFVVSLELLNSNSGNPFAASTTYDATGCQPGRNAVFVIPGGWIDACLVGVTGDWVIRAIVDDSVTVPAVSEWGLLTMALLVLTAGTFALRRRLTEPRP